MKVEQCMTSPPRTCLPTDSLARAAEIMWEQDCGCVPVVDPEQRPVGIVTDRDVCMAAYTQGASLHALEVGGAMAHVVYACRPEEDLAEAEKRMRSYQIRRLPVVDAGGRVVGVLSLSDIVRCASAAVEHGRPNGAWRLGEESELVTGLIATLGAVCAPRHGPGAIRAERAEPRQENGRQAEGDPAARSSRAAPSPTGRTPAPRRSASSGESRGRA